ncbi:MAG: DUF4382 domain-containing protein [Gemmatimonadota bacterium]
MRPALGFLTLPFVLGACDSTLFGTGEMRELTVALASASALAEPSPAITLNNVSLDAVGSIDVIVTGVQARLSDPEDVEGAWFPLEVVAEDPEVGVPVDLKNLGAAAITLAKGMVPEGLYLDVRLFFDGESATITTLEEICLDVEDAEAGEAQICLAAGTHPLFIPSGDVTGVKTDATFELGDDETVVLTFDEETTVQNLAWAPGLAAVVMNPVIRAANEAGE